MKDHSGPGRSRHAPAVVTRVIAAVAEDEGRDPLDLSPLAEVVDPDALDRITSGPVPVQISFSYHGYRVDVGADGHVRVTPEA